MSALQPILEMKAVAKWFPTPTGRAEILKGIDLNLMPGEFVAITGPSGSGKTTLLMLSALLSRPSSGTILFDGEEVSSKDEAWLCQHRKYRVGMVFQKFCLLPHRTVLENVLFRFRYLQHDPDDAKNRCLQALESMGLGAKVHQSARLLSSGEMQRVAIARSVALPPRLLVADEPTGNLDRESTGMVMECFKKLNEQGLTILLVTHNEELLKYCSRHLVCRSGVLEGEVSGKK
jgi:putative ABC transport system ATP-binding protein